ncbi:MAG: glycosyltransferase family 2 protein [Leptolyngbya sp. SIO1D8]|nr:glycosyltransferase family 2 protein [Leptolyngbya sp. SIO1D8]
MASFSVVICTYNGAHKLPRVLERLKLQRKTVGIDWEVLVVDNNSTDDTASVVHQYQKSWLADVPLRYYFEPKQGLAYARRCAIRHVAAPLVGFLDDDNLPQDTWIYEAWQFGHQHPKAGAYGSEVQPIYDVPPPKGFRRIAPLLAIIDRGAQPFTYPKHHGLLPVGAGMVVRREAWLAHVPSSPWLAGVTNKSLKTKGEDVETLSYIRDADWEVWHNPAMKIEHHLPVERIQRAYLLELCRSVGCNRFPLRMVRYQPWQRPFVLPLYMLNDFRRLIFYLMRYYRSFPEDMVCACELALLSSSLASPFYHWWNSWVAEQSAAPVTPIAREHSSSHST